MHRFHYIGSYSFCMFRTIQVLDALFNKTRKNHSINFKISPMYFWRLLPLFEYQKRPNRIINKKGTEFCRFLGGKIFFCKFFLDSVFFPSVAHFKLGTGIATQNCYRNTCLVPPLVTNIKKYFLYHNKSSVIIK